MEERRKFIRLNLNIVVEWEKINELSNEVQSGKFMSRDFSGGGIRLIVDDTIKTGDNLRLNIKLPTGKTICSKGKVIWVEYFEIVGGRHEKSYESGIEFFEISNEDKEEIKNFVFSSLREAEKHSLRNGPGYNYPS